MVVSVPWMCSLTEARLFVEKNREWILRTRERQQVRTEKWRSAPENADIVSVMGDAAGDLSGSGTLYWSGSGTPEVSAFVEQLRAEAKRVLPRRLAELSQFAAARTGMDFSFNRAAVKHNRSNWGSCSRRRNINMNINLVRPTVPPELRDYVLLHELCHLQVPNHGPHFHSLLEALCPGHRALSRRLRRYHLI